MNMDILPQHSLKIELMDKAAATTVEQEMQPLQQQTQQLLQQHILQQSEQQQQQDTSVIAESRGIRELLFPDTSALPLTLISNTLGQPKSAVITTDVNAIPLQQPQETKINNITMPTSINIAAYRNNDVNLTSSSNTACTPHPGRESGKNTKSCKVCGRVLHSTSLNRHMKTHRVDAKINSLINTKIAGEYACNICNKVYFQLPVLQTHVRKCHLYNVCNTERSSQCTICLKFFYDKWTMRRHMKFSHPVVKTETDKSNVKIEGGFKCPLCVKIFNSKLVCDHHLRTVHNVDNLGRRNMTSTGRQQKEQQCSICQKYFYNKQTMIRHVKQVHKGERPTLFKLKKKPELEVYMCTRCSLVFDAEKDLVRHNLQRHEELYDVPKPVKCKICKLIFDNALLLANHVCPKYDNQKDVFRRNLVNKQRSLSKSTCNKALKCAVCSRMLSNGFSLRRHLSLCHKLNTTEMKALKSSKYCRVVLKASAELNKKAMELKSSLSGQSNANLNQISAESTQVSQEASQAVGANNLNNLSIYNTPALQTSTVHQSNLNDVNVGGEVACASTSIDNSLRYPMSQSVDTTVGDDWSLPENVCTDGPQLSDTDTLGPIPVSNTQEQGLGLVLQNEIELQNVGAQSASSILHSENLSDDLVLNSGSVTDGLSTMLNKPHQTPINIQPQQVTLNKDALNNSIPTNFPLILPNGMPPRPKKIIDQNAAAEQYIIECNTTESFLLSGEEIINTNTFKSESEGNSSQTIRNNNPNITFESLITGNNQMIENNHGSNQLSNSPIPTKRSRISHAFAQAHPQEASSNKKNRPRPECPICKKTFYDRTTLNRHGKTMHKTEDLGLNRMETVTEASGKVLWKCLECLRTFDTKSGCIGHFASHTNKTNSRHERASCQICGKEFKSGYALAAHMRSHKTSKLNIKKENKSTDQENSDYMKIVHTLNEVGNYGINTSSETINASNTNVNSVPGDSNPMMTFRVGAVTGSETAGQIPILIVSMDASGNPSAVGQQMLIGNNNSHIIIGQANGDNPVIISDPNVTNQDLSNMATQNQLATDPHAVTVIANNTINPQIAKDKLPTAGNQLANIPTTLTNQMTMHVTSSNQQIDSTIPANNQLLDPICIDSQLVNPFTKTESQLAKSDPAISKDTGQLTIGNIISFGDNSNISSMLIEKSHWKKTEVGSSINPSELNLDNDLADVIDLDDDVTDEVIATDDIIKDDHISFINNKNERAWMCLHRYVSEQLSKVNKNAKSKILASKLSICEETFTSQHDLELHKEIKHKSKITGSAAVGSMSTKSSMVMGHSVNDGAITIYDSPEAMEKEAKAMVKGATPSSVAPRIITAMESSSANCPTTSETVRKSRSPEFVTINDSPQAVTKTTNNFCTIMNNIVNESQTIAVNSSTDTESAAATAAAGTVSAVSMTSDDVPNSIAQQANGCTLCGVVAGSDEKKTVFVPTSYKFLNCIFCHKSYCCEVSLQRHHKETHDYVAVYT